MKKKVARYIADENLFFKAGINFNTVLGQWAADDGNHVPFKKGNQYVMYGQTDDRDWSIKKKTDIILNRLNTNVSKNPPKLRDEVRHVSVTSAAAITLQCAWRVRVSKRRLFDARRAAAATRIQALGRMMVKRRKYAEYVQTVQIARHNLFG